MGNSWNIARNSEAGWTTCELQEGGPVKWNLFAREFHLQLLEPRFVRSYSRLCTDHELKRKQRRGEVTGSFFSDFSDTFCFKIDSGVEFKPPTGAPSFLSLQTVICKKLLQCKHVYLLVVLLTITFMTNPLAIECFVSIG